jgi:hypothetical protein
MEISVKPCLQSKAVVGACRSPHISGDKGMLATG